MFVPKLSLTPIKIRIFGPKTAKSGPKYAFLSFRAKYCHFLHILSNARPKTNVTKVPGWVFRYVGYKTFDFSSKKRIFCFKTTKFGQKLAFLVILGQAMQAYSMPCCGSVGGCGARAVSRKTPIYFIVVIVVVVVKNQKCDLNKYYFCHGENYT